MARGGTTFTLTPELRRTSTVVVLGSIMSILDTTIVAVALATLGPGLPRVGDHHPMGRHRLPSRARHGDPGLGLGGRSIRGEEGLDALDRSLRRRVQPLRPCLVGELPHLLPRAAGRWRRHAPPGGPVDPGPRRRAATNGPRHEHHRGADGAGPDPGTRHRRPDRLQLQLALDLLHQRPDRHRHAAPLAALAAQVRHRGTVVLGLRHLRVLFAVARPGRARLRARRRSERPAASPARRSS